MQTFHYGGLTLHCHSNYDLHFRETFILDVYNSNLINREDIVVDVGASSGDFCFLASLKTGPKGKVIAIEPNPDDYKILTQNIEKNNIQNIIPVNIGVSDHQGRGYITFKGKSFSFDTNTLSNILNSIGVNSVDFIKLDIEGYEVEVIRNAQKLFADTRVVAMEFHNTKEKVDSFLLNLGFTYFDISTSYQIKKLMKSSIGHPFLFVSSAVALIRNNPRLIYKVIKGYDNTKNVEGIYNGYYVKTSKKN